MDYTAEYTQMKVFLEFDDDDVSRLKALGPLFASRGPEITDAFYARLAADAETAPIIEGRVDALKRTHIAWMGRLFDGEYGDVFLEEQLRVGRVHVRAGIVPRFVELIGSVLRQEGVKLIRTERIGDVDRVISSYLKVLDLALSLINYAYADERLNRMSRISGMSRTLIDRLIARAD